MGKRGGVRVIYFYYDAAIPLYLLLIYAEAQREDLTADEKRRVRALAEGLKQAYWRVRPLTLIYKGESITVDMPGWYGDLPDGGVHTSDDMKVSDRALNPLKARIK